MSKTTSEISLIAGGIALALASGPVGIAMFQSLTVMNGMIGIGITTTLSGVGLALRPTPLPAGITNTITFATGSQYRRVGYGQFLTPPLTQLLTYASFPAGQNNTTTAQFLHLVATIVGHEITSFDSVLINGTAYNLGAAANDIQSPGTTGGSGGNIALWEVKPGNNSVVNDFYYTHVFFEFDFGRDEANQPFPNLVASDPAWTSACLQQGCAKVHIILRADSGWTAVFPSGEIPNIQFLCTGKKLIDPRVVTAWEASAVYAKYQYILDSRGILWVATSTSGTSGSTEPAFSTTGPPGTLTDGSVTWETWGNTAELAYVCTDYPQGQLVNNRLINQAWAASTTYAENWVIESPIGYFQMQTASGGTGGSALPAFSTSLGGTTSDGSQAWVCLGRSPHALNNANSALVVNDYLQDTDAGLGVSLATIDETSVIAAANVCEEQALIMVVSGGAGSASSDEFVFSQESGTPQRLRSVSGTGEINTLSLTSSDSIWNANGFGSLAGGAVDSAGNIYVCDGNPNASGSGVAYKIDTSTLVVTRVAGAATGSGGSSGAALSAYLSEYIFGVALDAAGNVYIYDVGQYVVFAINMQATTQTLLGVSIAPGDIAIVAGTLGTHGFYGDGGPATSAKLYPNNASAPGIAFDSSGNLYISDSTNYRIRKVTPGGTISTIAGNGLYSFGGSSTAATHAGDEAAASAAYFGPLGPLAIDADDNLYVVEQFSATVFSVSEASCASNGSPVIYTGTFSVGRFNGASNAWVGMVSQGFGFSPSLLNANLTIASSTSTTLTSDYGGGPATDMTGGSVEIAMGCCVRAINLSGGTQSALGISIAAGNVDTVANQQCVTTYGTGYAYSSNGNGGAAASCAFKNRIYAMAVDSEGNLNVIDWEGYVIRQILASTGIISTIAGTGTSGYTGDAGAATAAKITSVYCVTPSILGLVGVYENQYSCNGMFDHSSLRGNVLSSLCGSMAGWVIPPGDFWHIFAGAYLTPTVSLGDADMRAPIKGDLRLSKRDVANGIKGTYIPNYLPTNPAAALALTQVPATWQQQSFPPYQANGLAGKPDYLNSEDGGEIIWQDMQLDFTTSLWTAQRLAKIALMRLRFQQTVTLPCKITAFEIEAGDTFYFTHERWGLSGAVFEASQCSLVFDSSSAGGGKDSVPAIAVDPVGRQVDPSIYTFTPPSSPTDYGEYSPFGVTGVMTGVE